MTENKEWVKPPTGKGRWNPEPDIPDTLRGIYLCREEAPYRNRMNWKYFVRTDHPSANREGIAHFYGTEAINEGMRDIPENQDYEIEVEYKGDRPTRDPKKKPYRMFEVRVKLSKDDPLYQKWYPDETEKPEPESKGIDLNRPDDQQAQQYIKELVNEMHTEKVEFNPMNPRDGILKYARDNQEKFKLSDEDLTRIDNQLTLEHARIEAKMKRR